MTLFGLKWDASHCRVMTCLFSPQNQDLGQDYGAEGLKVLAECAYFGLMGEIRAIPGEMMSNERREATPTAQKPNPRTLLWRESVTVSPFFLIWKKSPSALHAIKSIHLRTAIGGERCLLPPGSWSCCSYLHHPTIANHYQPLRHLPFTFWLGPVPFCFRNRTAFAIHKSVLSGKT